MDIKLLEAARTRIAPYTRQTPFLNFEYLSKRTGKDIWMKCETLQRTGSFKIRGAANCILENIGQAKKAGVIAASAGNHAQGVAAIAHRLGIHSTIVMPVTTPAIKVHNTAAWGAEIILHGQVYNDSFQEAKRLSLEKGLLFIHPFNDPLTMAGQGTLALEMLDNPDFAGVEAVVIPVGGGGLIAGCSHAIRARAPQVKIYGVSAKNAPACWLSYHQKTVVEQPVRHTIAEGVATKKADPEMLALLQEGLDDFFAIEEESIAFAISLLAEHAKLLVEGAGALPIAAILADQIPEKKVAVVLSGGNIDIPLLSNVLQRGLVEQGRLVRVLIGVPDRPGGLNAITEILAKERANILQVLHQRLTLHTPFGETEIEIDMETRGKEHTEKIIAALEQAAMKVIRLA